MSMADWLSAVGLEVARRLSARAAGRRRERTPATRGRSGRPTPHIAESLEPRFLLSVPAVFQPQQTFATGTAPVSVAVSDVNGDGKPDLVVANISDSVSVLLGNGNGTFAAQQTFAAGSLPRSIAVSDANGDGKPDIVVADYHDTVSVLLGNGDGTFAAPETYNVGSAPSTIAVSDVNGDGKPDILVDNSNSKTVSILLGNGNGTFAPQQTVSTGTVPFSLAVSDVNGDGKPDIIAVSSYSNSIVNILLGNGNGTFAAPKTFAAGSSSSSVVVSDVNDDGKADLVIANYNGHNVSVLLGNGNGTFAAQQTFFAGLHPLFAAVSDVNGDGKADLAVVNDNATTVNVLLGNGDGTFAPEQTFAVGSGPAFVAVADVNGDGKADLVVLNGGSDSVSVLLGDPPPVVQSITRTTPIGPTDNAASVTYTVTFSEPVTGVDGTDFSLVLSGAVTTIAPVVVSGSGAAYTVTINGISGSGTLGLNLANDGSIQDSLGTALGPAGVFQPQQTYAVGAATYDVAAADINGDGKPDLIVPLTSSRVAVLLGNGNGSFAAQQTFAAGSSPHFVAVADVNGDGRPDLIVANFYGSNISVLLGNGNGTFAPQQTFATGTKPRSIATADFNGDGKLDLIVADYGATAASVLLGNGDGTFAAQQTLATGVSPRSVVAADVNRDGKMDFVVANQNSNNAGVFLGHGDGSFAAQLTFATGQAPLTVVVADFNGDGKLDLAVPNETNNTASVLLGNGNGTFAAQLTYATSENPYALTVGDVNSDGKPDLIATNRSANNAGIFLGNGNGTFAPQQTVAAGAYPQFAFVSDLNSDGKPDIAFANYRSRTVSVLLNNPTGSFAGQTYLVYPPAFQPPKNSPAGSYAASVAVADVNGDGKPDLVTANKTSSTVSILLGNGNGTFASQQTIATPTATVAIAVSDVNGDGKADLIVDNNSGSVGVRLGNGNGTFGAQVTFAAGANTRSLAVADVNGDGKVDIAVTNYGNNTVSVLLGNGNGTFGAPSVFPAGNFPITVAIADLNHDGKPDLVVGDTTVAAAVAVLLGNGNGTFRPVQTFATEVGPSSVAVADLNGDGNPDLAVVNSLNSSISVLLGNGNGTFAPRQDFITGFQPRAVVAADLNGDGKVDLAVTNFGFSTVSLLLGNGNGTFGPPETFASTIHPAYVVAADVNSDGRLDLVTVDSLSNQASVLLGDPAPTVQSINRTTPTGPTTSATSVTYTVTFSKPVTGVDPTDFSLALSGSVTATTPVVVAGSGAVYTVTISGISGAGTLGLNLVNDGSIQDSLGNPLGPIGTFQAQQSFATGASTQPHSVVVADVNGDGKPDLIVTNTFNVGVFLGNGNGTFGPQQTFSASFSQSIAVADVNGDGKVDLVVSNVVANNVGVLLGNGNGTFQPDGTFAAGKSPVAASVADVNGDGKADLIVVNRDSNSVGVLLGNGNGTFGVQQTFAIGSTPLSVAVADVNGDGRLDLVVANSGDSTLGVLLGNGNGTFQGQVTLPSGFTPCSVVVADVNGDGKPDLIVSNSGGNSVGVLLGNGNGTFAAQASFATGAGSSPQGVAVADVNGDGKPDLIVANRFGYSVGVFLGNGNGAFNAQQTFSTGAGSWSYSVAVADVNRDGKSDLVVANSVSRNVGVLLADTSGNFTGQAYSIVDTPPTITSNGGGDTASVSVLENTTAVTTVTATDPDAGQTLTYSIIGGADAAKFQINNGVLTFITPPDFNHPTDVGADNVYNVTVQVSDGDGGTDSQAIAVTVLNFNQPPTFTPGANVTVNEDSGAQTIPGWATGISAGPPSESGQTLTFTVTGITPADSALQDQWTGYAGDPQHEAISSVASQPLDAIRWSTPVDLDPQFWGNDLYVHYGTPLITQANTVIVPVKTGASDGFELEAVNGSNGSLIWSQATDYTLPPHDSWTPSYSPALVGNRIYFAGAGGTVYYRDSVDSAMPTGSGQIAFYGMSNYTGNPSAYNSSIHISTPITADAAGNIYFGFQADGSNPLGITDGFARITPNGSATYTSVATATGGALNHALTNAAPAVSLDGQHIYVAVSTGFGFGTGDLLELNSTTLATQASVALKDPSSGQNAYLPDDGTASPMVGPDGDVYFGVLENPFPANHDRGWMLHFSSDLSQEKTPGAFGWDDTASVVPASMVPSYHGSSSYLIMTKYNNYADPGIGGDGVNKIAILDPNATEIDPITGATVMNEVLTIAGVTPNSDLPGVREWCINTAVVDPATDSILANSEDGKLYRWDLATNTFTQVITLTPGVGEAYTPTLIGADGTVYAINDATLYAVGYSQQNLNTGLFSVPPSVDPATGNLTFTPAPSALGTSQITLSLMDNGGTANGGVDTTTHTFTITVAPIAAISAIVTSSATVVPGQSAQFTVTVSNDGQTNATGVAVSDILPPGVLADNYVASDNGMGATGYTAKGSGNIADTVNLPAGAQITYTVNGVVSSSATGTITDSATAATASGVTNTEANVPASTTTYQSSVTVSLTPQADVYVAMSGSDPLVIGGTDVYTIVVTNHGFSDITGVPGVTGLTVADPFTFLTGATVSSTVLFGTAAGNSSGALPAGGLNDILTMRAGAIVEYTITGTVATNAPSTLTSTVSLTLPSGTTDPVLANNSSSVSAAVVASGGTVLARSVFYADSIFDGNNLSAATAPTTADFAAIAPDKVPLLPGQTATFNNYTGYVRGINGIFVDLTGDVPANITAADFTFTVGNTNPAGTGWATLATAPTVTMFAKQGIAGSDRIALTWPNGTIAGKWLQVTVNADANTGLSVPDVFYFGNAPGESGNSTTDAHVNATDEVQARNDPHSTFANPAPIADPNDFDRDARTNATDEVIARNNGTNFQSALKLIAAPGLPNGNGVSSSLATSIVVPAFTTTPAPAADSGGVVADSKKLKSARLEIVVVAHPGKSGTVGASLAGYHLSLGARKSIGDYRFGEKPIA